MPEVRSSGVTISYEETGSGTPLVFLHEFSGDQRSWEQQVRYFSRRYRCVTFAARGYLPSEVPADPSLYSQRHAVQDGLAVLDGLGIERAHLVGLSMGGFTALHLALSQPGRVRSLTIGGVGYGCTPEPDGSWASSTEALADFYLEDPLAAAAAHAIAPGRVPFQRKDPRGWSEFAAQLAEHPAIGSANTMRGVQGRRPNLYDLADELAALEVPMLILCGDEDEGCLEPSLFLKRTVRTSALAVLPRSGHTLNLEEPARFNQLLEEHLANVEAGRWTGRDPRSMQRQLLGRR
ncbi:MAG TPA: alpha/beta hydrolase [Acidimicrobiales bacterium]|nr:alpha/beta hydrolase [Acidimicrobiales bacterium]